MRLAKNTGILGASVYIDDQLVAENVAVQLPEISFAEAEVQAGAGPITVPIYPLPQALEASVTFRGQSEGLSAALASAGKTVEIRWAGSRLQPDQESAVVGFKAFLVGIPRTLPGESIDIGSVSDNQVTWAVTRYQLVEDGESVILIDKLAGKVEILGQDHASALANLL